MLPIKDKKLRDKAFTHRSYLNESDDSITESNERLEYLGDAVLELATSEFLYEKFPEKPEGELTALRAALVKTTTLAMVADRLKFGEELFMSKGEEQTGGRNNKSLLANTFEAVVGAMYLDSGFETATKFLQTELFPYIDEVIKNNLHKDYKSSFQELVQGQGHPTPTYNVVGSEGPDHEKIFTVSLLVNDKVISSGEGRSKQAAQQQAAKEGLEKLEANPKL